MSSKYLRSFDIDIFKLANKEHAYEFTFDDRLFEAFDFSGVEKGKGEVKVLLTKSDTVISLKFSIQGDLRLICDRSLDEFDFPLHLTETILLKYGDHEEELGDNLFMIQKDTQTINLAQFLHESISLAIPMKKLHPRFIEEEDESAQVFIYSSEEKQEIKNNDETDPRWDILKKLR